MFYFFVFTDRLEDEGQSCWTTDCYSNLSVVTAIFTCSFTGRWPYSRFSPLKGRLSSEVWMPAAFKLVMWRRLEKWETSLSNGVFFWLIAYGKIGFMPSFEELENPKEDFLEFVRKIAQNSNINYNLKVVESG